MIISKIHEISPLNCLYELFLELSYTYTGLTLSLFAKFAISKIQRYFATLYLCMLLIQICMRPLILHMCSLGTEPSHRSISSPVVSVAIFTRLHFSSWYHITLHISTKLCITMFDIIDKYCGCTRPQISQLSVWLTYFKTQFMQMFVLIYIYSHLLPVHQILYVCALGTETGHRCTPCASDTTAVSVLNWLAVYIPNFREYFVLIAEICHGWIWRSKCSIILYRHQ